MIGPIVAADDKRPGRLDWRLWLLLIVGMAAVLRFGVADHSLWFDEQASVFFSDQPFSRLWSDWMLRETNPALYYSVLRAWRAIFGSSDFAIRALSVSASLVVIVLVFSLARRAYGDCAGLIAAGLAALSGQQLYFAEQARAYIFVLCAALVAIDALLAFDGADSRLVRWRAAAVFAAAATCAIYLHTTMILFPAIVVVAVIAANPRRYIESPLLLLPLLVACLATLLGASWAIRHAVLQIIGHGDNIAAIGLLSLHQMAKYTFQTLFLSGYGGNYGGGADGTMNYHRVVLPVLVLFVTIVFAALDWRRRETRLLAMIGLLGIATFVVIGTRVPIFVPRTVFWISTVPLVLTAGALARVSNRKWRWAVTGVLIALLALDAGQLAPILEQEDWNTPVHRVSQLPEALLLVQGEAMAVLADEVCRRQLSRSACPYTIIAVTDFEDHYDSWARGLYAGPKVTTSGLRNRVADRSVFLFRKAAFHNISDLLHSHGMGHGVPADSPPLLGPLSAAALR